MFKRLYEKTMEQGKKEEGQGLAEVALFLALVVVVALPFHLVCSPLAGEVWSKAPS